MELQDYIEKIQILIETPKKELRYRVMKKHEDECFGLLMQYEMIHIEQCQKIEKFMEEDIDYIKRFREVD